MVKISRNGYSFCHAFSWLHFVIDGRTDTKKRDIYIYILYIYRVCAHTAGLTPNLRFLLTILWSHIYIYIYFFFFNVDRQNILGGYFQDCLFKIFHIAFSSHTNKHPIFILMHRNRHKNTIPRYMHIRVTHDMALKMPSTANIYSIELVKIPKILTFSTHWQYYHPLPINFFK